ncbi:MAG: hypothetical protein NTV61_08470 [Candidatus Bathyarchaeota archaeon]|nr:hypothetical protein [Candidatus Bathyarchaeota archaeon]
MSSLWREQGPVPRRLIQGAGFLVVAVFIFVFVGSAVPAENRLTPVLATDKEVYFVGETICVEASYVNPYSYPVSFSPPSTLPGISGAYEGEVSGANSIVNISWTASGFTVEPGFSFHVLRSEFTVASEGKFVVGWMSLSKTVQVLPSES